MSYSEGNVQVEITKDHESGLKVGQLKWLSPKNAKSLVAMKIAKLTDAKPPKEK